MSRDCCDSGSGLAHRNNCPVYLEKCPKWLPEIDDKIRDSGYRQREYMKTIRGMILYKGPLHGEIVYCWIGVDGWPTIFQVLVVQKECRVDWRLEDVIGPMDCNVPHPTAEQTYEMLRRAA